MHRFYIAPEDWNPDSLVLAGAEAHHARDVLRLQPAGRVVVFNGRGHEITAEIAKVTRDEIQKRLHLSPTIIAETWASWENRGLLRKVGKSYQKTWEE